MSFDRERAIRRTLIGEVPDDVTVVATPIRSMFTLLRGHGWADVEHGGWWPRLVRGGVHVVLIPQGGAVADLCVALAGSAQFELLGYAGSLTPTLEVGNVVRPAVAGLLGDHREFRLRGAVDGSGGSRLVTVPHLLATYDAVATLTAAVVADMECAFVAATLDRVSGPVPGTHLVITDRWPDTPFYDCGASLAGRIAIGREAAVESLVAELCRNGEL